MRKLFKKKKYLYFKPQKRGVEYRNEKDIIYLPYIYIMQRKLMVKDGLLMLFLPLEVDSIAVSICPNDSSGEEAYDELNDILNNLK